MFKRRKESLIARLGFLWTRLRSRIENARRSRKASALFLALELAKRTVRKFQADECMHMAASIAYYALFSLFPLLLGLMAIFGFILEPKEVQGRLLEITVQVLPGSGDLVTRNIEGIVASRGALAATSLLGLFWSATAIFAAIRISLNRAWNVQQQRPFLKQKLLEFAMLAGAGFLFLLSIAATALFQLSAQFRPVETILLGTVPRNVIMFLLPMAFSFAIFALLYRFVPNTRVTWGDVWAGALLAAVLFEIAKNVYGWYLTNWATYSLVYGSVATVIGFLLWAYLSALVLLLGAELASEYSRLLGSQRR